MSTIKVNTIQTASGTEVYTAKAWVNFNGTGTVAINASGNVSSITDNGTGNYTLNFTTAMSDANYSFAGAVRRDNDANDGIVQIYRGNTQTQSTTALAIKCGYAASGGIGGNFDPPSVYVVIFR